MTTISRFSPRLISTTQLFLPLLSILLRNHWLWSVSTQTTDGAISTSVHRLRALAPFSIPLLSLTLLASRAWERIRILTWTQQAHQAINSPPVDSHFTQQPPTWSSHGFGLGRGGHINVMSLDANLTDFGRRVPGLGWWCFSSYPFISVPKRRGLT